MNINNSVHFNGVYYLESQNPNMNPLAIRPEVTPPDYAAWNDTANGRMMHCTKVLINGEELKERVDPKGVAPDRIEIIDNQGNSFKLVKLTTELFNEKLKDLVAGGANLNFSSDQELQNYFLKTF
jgi:hypothetical protein